MTASADWAGPVAVALIAALGMVWQTRINSKTTSRSNMDDRASETLDKALAYQARQIDLLTTRVAHLEREVEACERGRAADRASFSVALAEIRERLTDDGPWPEINPALPPDDLPSPA